MRTSVCPKCGADTLTLHGSFYLSCAVCVLFFDLRTGEECDEPDDPDLPPPLFAEKSTEHTTISGAQRVDTYAMSDRRLLEQIEYNTRISADVLRRMWILVAFIVVLNVIGAIAMAVTQ